MNLYSSEQPQRKRKCKLSWKRSKKRKDLRSQPLVMSVTLKRKLRRLLLVSKATKLKVDRMKTKKNGSNSLKKKRMRHLELSTWNK